jgi:hypothetical protein
MRRAIAFVVVALLLVAGTAVAQQGMPAKPKMADRVEVTLAPGAKNTQAVATVTLANAQPARIVSIPFEFKAEGHDVWLDSVSYEGTRVQEFKLRNHTFYPDRSAVLLLMSAPRTSEGYQDLEPSAGAVAHVFLGSEGAFPLKALKVQAVDLPPGNKLMYVTGDFTGVTPEFMYRLADDEGATKSAAKE